MSFDCGNGYSVSITASDLFLKYAATMSIAYCSSNYGLFASFNMEFSISKLLILGITAVVLIVALVYVYAPLVAPFVEGALMELIGYGATTFGALQPI